MLLYKLLKEQAQNIALLMPVLKLHMMLLRKFPCLLKRLHLVPINARILLHGIHHGNPLERLFKIHLHAIIRNHRRPENFLRHMAVQILRQIHHPIIIRIRLIKLHQRKLRVMTGIQALVAEHAPNLIHSFKTAHDKPLQIQL